MSVIIDRNADKEVLDTLQKNNISFYKSYDLDYLYRPVNTHPDMQIHFVDNFCAVVAPYAYEYYKNILPNNIKLIEGESNPGCSYPNDCAYNVARMGKRVIGNHSYTDKRIKEIYTQKGYEFINVRQGYTKCNLCIVDENTAITEDEGLNKVLIENKINVLKLLSTEVSLPGFKNGFIGGASGFVDNKTLGFSGNLAYHPQYNEIKNFIKGRGVDIIYLSSTKLCDLGSLLYFESIE